MDPERWKLVDDLLQSALLLPEDRQEEFLQTACEGDATLLDEVRSLLTSHHRAADFLEKPAIDLAAQSLAFSQTQEIADPLVGQIISPTPDFPTTAWRPAKKNQLLTHFKLLAESCADRFGP